MWRVFPALPAELLEFQPARRGLLVLGRGVVTVLTLSTLQRHNLAGHGYLPFRLLRSLDCEALSAPCAEISRRSHAAEKNQNYVAHIRLLPAYVGTPKLWVPRSTGPLLAGRAGTNYARISLIVPAPTVRPPSRIANRRPFSIATGVISSISSATLSPGITISVPAGKLATPVTSVVRK